MERGGQVYDASNRVKTIDDAMERVREAAPEARVGVAHGKMSPREVEDVMLQFATKKIDVLIATTIVESGIDNASANTLIIEDSQRLGLAQLYQLKGRVGRSSTQAYAYFMFPGELPLTEEATARLMALSEFQDLGSGMRIAMRDLEIRGAGSLVGAEQHGNLSSVGFDLFTQMLGQAVAEARGDDDGAVEQAGIAINLPADFYLDEEYVPAVDQRVLVYRRVAAAEDLEAVDRAQEECEEAHGMLPEAALNLFDRARIRIRGERMGLEKRVAHGRAPGVHGGRRAQEGRVRPQGPPGRDGLSQESEALGAVPCGSGDRQRRRARHQRGRRRRRRGPGGARRHLPAGRHGRRRLTGVAPGKPAPSFADRAAWVQAAGRQAACGRQGAQRRGASPAR